MAENNKSFMISIAKNETMQCFEVVLQIGAMATKDEAEAFAKILSEWLRSRSESGWAARVQ